MTIDSEIQEQVNVQQNARLVQGVLDALVYRSPEDVPWNFGIVAHAGWDCSLRIRVNARDSNDSRGGGMVRQLLIDHLFRLPVSTLDRIEAERFVLDCILLVHRHEACENFWVGDRRPYYPEHGSGADPYRLRRIEECGITSSHVHAPPVDHCEGVPTVLLHCIHVWATRGFGTGTSEGTTLWGATTCVLCGTTRPAPASGGSSEHR